VQRCARRSHPRWSVQCHSELRSDAHPAQSVRWRATHEPAPTLGPADASPEDAGRAAPSEDDLTPQTTSSARTRTPTGPPSGLDADPSKPIGPSRIESISVVHRNARWDISFGVPGEKLCAIAARVYPCWVEIGESNLNSLCRVLAGGLVTAIGHETWLSRRPLIAVYLGGEGEEAWHERLAQVGGHRKARHH
jgi:hypothetical protein